MSKQAHAKTIKIGLINTIQGKNCPSRIEPKIISLSLNLNLEIAYTINNGKTQAIESVIAFIKDVYEITESPIFWSQK